MGRRRREGEKGGGIKMMEWEKGKDKENINVGGENKGGRETRTGAKGGRGGKRRNENEGIPEGK